MNAKGGLIDIPGWLLEALAAELEVAPPEIDVAQSLASLGLDSIRATTLAYRIETELGVPMSAGRLLELGTLSTLVTCCVSEQGTRRDPVVASAPVSGDYPLSRGQQALWFLHQLAPASTAYHLAHALRLTGRLDAGAFHRACQRLVDRHGSLRTTFPASHGLPRQCVHASMEIAFAVEDASSSSSAELQARLDAAVQRPFDLARGPLLTVTLFRRSADEHVLLLLAHHIILDLWSLALLLQELDLAYAAEAAGAAAPLPAAPVYTDYVDWQAKLLASPGGARLAAYWRERLGGELPALNLPVDHARQAVPSTRGGTHRFRLSSRLATALKAVARAHATTPFSTLLAAFQVLLHRYTGEHDVLVGTPTTGRTRPEWAGIVGYFVNPVVLRADLSGNPAFADVLRKAQRTVLGALRRQDHPFSLLVEELRPARDPGRSPLFEVMFVFEQPPSGTDARVGALAIDEAGGPALGKLQVEAIRLAPRAPQFDLTLVMAESGDTFVGSWEYDAALFDAATIARMAECFIRLLDGLVEEPSRPIRNVPLVGAAERQLLLVGWNDSARDYPRERCLHELFEVRAAATPDALAVTDAGGDLRYGELDQRANQLAHRLRGLGIGPQRRVGVALDRSCDLVVALLAVLKAGGAYVPLDSAYPPERLAFMLNDGEVAVLLTRTRHRERFPADGIQVVLVDAEREAIARASGSRPSGGARPDDLAYVIYTSGSTGQPKGVGIEHRNAVNLVCWGAELLGPEDLAGVLAGTSICWDLSVFEIFVPLSAGGRVILADSSVQLPARWVDRLTLVNTVPSAAAELVRADALPASVRTVILAGEPLPAELVRALYGRGTVRRVFNCYGPSETTTYSSFALIERDPGRPPPIGRPIANTTLYVLDDAAQPVPIGVAGELSIGGAGVARGYVRRPELTAERFLPDPFSPDPAARLYRTGDLVRHRADGNLEFLGRVDHQVKVRGYRIELGEIEAALARHPGVREAVVVARHHGPNDMRVVAYVVPAPGSVLAGPELRGFLRRTLPDFMLPAAFVVLDALPRTTSGKVDRRALPAPAFGARAVAGSYAPPRSPIEEALVGIWSDLLGAGRVGVHDDFFELGGHSLLATQVMSRIRELFGLGLPLRCLFEGPTIAQLAERLALAPHDRPAADASPIRRLARAGPVPLSFSQQRLWFLEQFEPGTAAYNVPLALHIRGTLDPAALQRTLDRLVGRHEVLRTTFTLVDGEPAQVVQPPAPVPLPFVDLVALPGAAREAEARRLAAEEGRRPFDLGREWPLRAMLVRVAPDTHLLVLTLHHIAIDGWSTGILVREMSALYEAFASGRPAALPDVPLQYADFACWQRAGLEGALSDALLAYWRARLAGPVAPLQLPADRPRPRVQSSRGARETRPLLPPPLSEAVKTLSRQEGGTPFMVLLAAFQTLLHRYTGAEDIAVGSPIANRTRVELEGVVGCFVNTLVLRTDLSGDPTFRELLGRVREVALGAYTHQELPFEKLVEELRPERDPSRTPLFQAMFVLQNFPMPPLRLPELTLTPVDVDLGVAQFDLSLTIVDTPGGLMATAEYNADLFEPPRIRRLLEHFQTLLEAIIADPEQPISRLRLLPEDEREQLVVRWNATATELRRETCVHERIEVRAAQTPDAIAVVLDNTQLTYGELDARANQLARHLRGLGVGREAAVGEIFLERSLETIVAVLGVLKAGAAYLPLDPSYPEERLALMLEDARAPVVLTEERLRGRLPEHPARVLLDTDWHTIARQSPTRLRIEVQPADLAYVIFTSGSTGRPKGVTIEHGSLLNFTEAAGEAYGITPCDRVLQFAGLGFDASVEEIFPCLTRGATLVLHPEATAVEPATFMERCRDWQLTVISLPTGYWHELTVGLGAALRGLAPSLRLVVIGGERAAAATVETWYQHVGSRIRLVNTYGPTEATVVATMCELSPEVVGAEVPIGRPIENVGVYVLDGRMEPVPIGVAGELYIGGAGVARGYLHRPELTAERFLPDPFSSDPAARLYRTGDLARYRPDGNLEFLGRVDHQVKVRGYRIELGEIEAALGRYPAVREAVVIARDHGPNDTRLVAYVVPAPGAAPAGPELRAWLRRTLPHFMLPAAFVVLDAMPRTASGKPDRRALPAPAFGARSAPRDAPAAPRDALELQLTRLWEDVLGIRPVGLTDGFFALGGHSLLAVRLMVHVEQLTGRRLPLATLFEDDTIGHLARILRGQAAAPPWSPLVAIQPRGAKRPFFCVHPGGGGVLCYLDLARRLDPDRPFYGLQAIGLDGVQAPPTRLEEMVSSYVEAVRVRQPTGPYLLGGWCVGGVVAYEMARQLRAQGETVSRLVLIDSEPPAGGEALDDDSLASWFRWELLGRSPARPTVDSGGELQRTLDLARQASVVPPELELRELQVRLEVFAAVIRAVSRYTPGGYPGPVTLFRPSAPSPTGMPESAAPAQGWEHLAALPVATARVPGDHYTMLAEPHVEFLAERLGAELDLADEGGTA